MLLYWAITYSVNFSACTFHFSVYMKFLKHSWVFACSLSLPLLHLYTHTFLPSFRHCVHLTLCTLIHLPSKLAYETSCDRSCDRSCDHHLLIAAACFLSERMWTCLLLFTIPQCQKVLPLKYEGLAVVLLNMRRSWIKF